MHTHDSIAAARLGAVLAFALASTSCGDAAALREQLQGSWNVESYTCGTQDYDTGNVLEGAFVTVEFSGDEALLTFSDALCKAVEHWSVLYEEDGQITLHDPRIACTPNPCTKLTGERCDTRRPTYAVEQSFTVRFPRHGAREAIFHYREDCQETGELLMASLALVKR